MKRFLGALMLLGGAGLAAWLAYGHLSGELKDRSPLAGVGFCIGLFVVGLMWIRSKPTRPRDPRTRAASDIEEDAPSGAFGMNLNLSALTAAGWFLLVCTFGAVIGCSIALVFLVPNAEKWVADKRTDTLIGVAGVAVAICFFQLGKLGLGVLGLPIYRRKGR